MDITLDPQESFKIGYEYLKARIEYIFNSRKMKPDTWCVAYWSVKVQMSVIIKFGTKEQKDFYLPKIYSSEHWCFLKNVDRLCI